MMMRDELFGQLLNVQGVGGIRQTERQTAELYVPEPSVSEIEVAIGKLKSVRCHVLIRFQQK
jgi:hypothetical protein